MTGVRITQRKEYEQENYPANRVEMEVNVILDKTFGRKEQHLIEEKIDRLFDEVDTIMAASGHTA